MKHRHFTQAARRLTALTLALLLALPLGLRRRRLPQLRTTRELADGLTYSNTITSHSAAGRVESFSLELSPDSREVEPIFLQASGTAYGAGSINLAVSYAQSLGYHVLGAINTDFFAPSTGVPLGISIEDGIYKSSPEAEAAVVITDGEVELVEQPQVTPHPHQRVHRRPDRSDPPEQIPGRLRRALPVQLRFFHRLHPHQHPRLDGAHGADRSRRHPLRLRPSGIGGH